MNYTAELTKGIEVEREHADVWAALQAGHITGEDTLYSMIAEAHLRELPDYYTRLASMESADDLSARHGARQGAHDAAAMIVQYSIVGALALAGAYLVLGPARAGRIFKRITG